MAYTNANTIARFHATTPVYRMFAKRRIRFRRLSRRTREMRMALLARTASALPVHGIRLLTTGLSSTPPCEKTASVVTRSRHCSAMKMIIATPNPRRESARDSWLTVLLVASACTRFPPHLLDSSLTCSTLLCSVYFRQYSFGTVFKVLELGTHPSYDMPDYPVVGSPLTRIEVCHTPAPSYRETESVRK